MNVEIKAPISFLSEPIDPGSHYPTVANRNYCEIESIYFEISVFGLLSEGTNA